MNKQTQKWSDEMVLWKGAFLAENVLSKNRKSSLSYILHMWLLSCKAQKRMGQEQKSEHHLNP